MAELVHGPIFRDFDAEQRELSGDPIQYKLGGVLFTCVNPVPVGLTVVMTRRMVGLDMNDVNNGATVQVAAQSASLLWDFTVPEEHAELDRVISAHPNPPIQAVVEYIITTATGRFSQGS